VWCKSQNFNNFFHTKFSRKRCFQLISRCSLSHLYFFSGSFPSIFVSVIRKVLMGNDKAVRTRSFLKYQSIEQINILIFIWKGVRNFKYEDISFRFLRDLKVFLTAPVLVLIIFKIARTRILRSQDILNHSKSPILSSEDQTSGYYENY
jgi:uncharacterized membrane protein SirB2